MPRSYRRKGRSELVKSRKNEDNADRMWCKCPKYLRKDPERGNLVSRPTHWRHRDAVAALEVINAELESEDVDDMDSDLEDTFDEDFGNSNDTTAQETTTGVGGSVDMGSFDDSHMDWAFGDLQMTNAYDGDGMTDLADAAVDQYGNSASGGESENESLSSTTAGSSSDFYLTEDDEWSDEDELVSYFTSFDLDDLSSKLPQCCVTDLSEQSMAADEDAIEKLIKTIALLNAKVRHNLAEAAIKEIRQIFSLTDTPSQYSAIQTLKRLTGLEERRIDCCIHSCIAFTGIYENDDTCPCGEPRYDPAFTGTPRRPRKTFSYLPLIPRLILQYSNAERSRIFKTYPASVSAEECCDFWNGSTCETLRKDGYFASPTDLALLVSTDGVNLVRQRNFDTWPIIILNLNLPPEIRVQKENILLSGAIPGPQNPKDLNTFLRPLIEELKVWRFAYKLTVDSEKRCARL